jgi:TonB family protein
MRRIVLSALFLSPVVLHAQANLSPVNQSILRASFLRTKGVESLFADAPTARTDRDPVGIAVAPDSIQTVITSSAEATQEFADHDEEFTNGQHVFTFNGQPAQFEAPKLVHWTPIHCVESDLDAANASEKKLQISMVINQAGAPEDIKIVHSVDPVLDHKAVEALSQYRFTPATMDHRPTAAPVTVSINFPAR